MVKTQPASQRQRTDRHGARRARLPSRRDATAMAAQTQALVPADAGAGPCDGRAARTSVADHVHLQTGYLCADTDCGPRHGLIRRTRVTRRAAAYSSWVRTPPRIPVAAVLAAAGRSWLLRDDLW